MKMLKITMIAGAVAVFATLQAQNLIPLPMKARLDSPPGVKFTNDVKNNTQKLVVEKYHSDKDGNLCIGATLYLGSQQGDNVPGLGIPVEPDTEYVIRFEYQGDVPRFWFGAWEFTGKNFWKDRERILSKCLAPAKNNQWMKAQYTVCTGKKAERLGVSANLYTNEKDKMFDLELGQSLSLRNVSIVKKP